MVAQTFDNLNGLASSVGAVRRGLGDHGEGKPVENAAETLDAIGVVEPLRGLLPGGLRRGDVVALDTRDRAPETLALALLAGALRDGLWCAAVGVPEVGVLAVAELLGPGAHQDAALDRLLLVPDPAGQWAEVVTALADGVDLLLARPTAAIPAQVARRVDARLRQGRSAGTRHSAVLLVLGPWSTARLVLRTAETQWTGLDGFAASAGTGHLTGGRAVVIAEGRATAGRPRTTRLRLPAANGAAQPLTEAGQEPTRLHPVA